MVRMREFFGGERISQGAGKRLGFGRRNVRGRITVFTSGKGGVGKTSIATATASVLAAEYERHVLLVDMDTGLRNVDLCFGVEDEVIFNLYDVVERGVKWEDALITTPDLEGLYILVTDQARGKEAISEDAFRRVLLEMSCYFDHIFLDCPAGIEYGFDLATSQADEAAVVMTPEMPSLRGAAQVARLLAMRNIAPVYGVLNKVVHDLVEMSAAASADEAAGITGIPIVAEIPMDLVMLGCSHLSIPLNKIPESLGIEKIPSLDAIRLFVERNFLGRFVFEPLTTKKGFLGSSVVQVDSV